MASDRGELALAEVARRKADEIEAESLAVDNFYDLLVFENPLMY